MAGVKAIAAGFDHNLVIESGLLTPVIFTQPTAQYAPTNSTVTFSAAGGGVAGVQYQWQFNGVNLTGQTNDSLTLTNTGATSQGSYQVVVTADSASITSSVATFTLVLRPSSCHNAHKPGDYLVQLQPNPRRGHGYRRTVSILVYSWQLNGTNISGASSANYTIPVVSLNEGTYTVTVTNIAGTTNSTWNMLLALPGMVEAWGDDAHGECDRPATLTNVMGIAAGGYQSVAVTDSGTVVQWGQYWGGGTNYYSVTNTNYVSLPPTSNVVAVAAGLARHWR